jgi:hypothetical protein
MCLSVNANGVIVQIFGILVMLLGFVTVALGVYNAFEGTWIEELIPVSSDPQET